MNEMSCECREWEVLRKKDEVEKSWWGDFGERKIFCFDLGLEKRVNNVWTEFLEVGKHGK